MFEWFKFFKLNTPYYCKFSETDYWRQPSVGRKCNHEEAQKYLNLEIEREPEDIRGSYTVNGKYVECCREYCPLM